MSVEDIWYQIIIHCIFIFLIVLLVRWIIRRIRSTMVNQESVDQIRKNVINSERFYLIGKLAGGVAHEINNPIMSIMNFSNLILDDLKGTNQNPSQQDSLKDARENLQEIIRQCERISKITKNLLDFSRPRPKNFEIQEIESLLLEVLNLLEPFLVKAQIQMLFDLPAKNHRCKINPGEIKEVFVNLINNSIYALDEKYARKERTRNEKYIKIAIREEKIKNELGLIDYVIVSVYDDGIGMTEEVKRNLFTPFVTTKKIKQGRDIETPNLGLGLVRSLSIIEDHKGLIKFESTVNIFSRFEVFLPILMDNSDNLFF